MKIHVVVLADRISAGQFDVATTHATSAGRPRESAQTRGITQHLAANRWQPQPCVILAVGHWWRGRRASPSGSSPINPFPVRAGIEPPPGSSLGP